jgi:hypothetical protein
MLTGDLVDEDVRKSAAGNERPGSLENSECNLCNADKRYIDMKEAYEKEKKRSNSIGDKGGDIFDTQKVRLATFKEDGKPEE